MEFRYCQYCKVKSFARIDNFKRHETVCFANPNRINFFCDICGKKFSRKDNLNNHLSKLHKQPKELIKSGSTELNKYLANTIPQNELFSVTKNINNVFESFSETRFQFHLTKIANSLCASGYMFNIMSNLIEHVMEQTNFRDSSDLCQIVIEHISLDYPISSGMVIGKEIDVNDILNRTQRVLQSERLINTKNDHNTIIISLFGKKYQ